jgi:predicted ferric reductase
VNVDASRRLAGRTQARSRPISRSFGRALTAWALLSLGAVNGAVIVWLWLQGGGVSSVHDLATLLTSGGRITGLLGSYLLLLQVVLLVRLPPLERLVGFDRLTVWHRRNGKICLYLILAHVVLITAGYTMLDRISLQSEISTLQQSYPGMVTATVGTVMLILTVVSSLVIVRRRLRYEAWYLVHLTAYAGILLSWFHQLPTGNEFITNSSASMYWTGLYLTTLALIVLYRFAQPAIRAFWYGLRVTEVKVEGPDAVSLRISGRHLNRLGARPGQFFLWRFLTPNRWWEAHPYSLSEAPNGKSLRITVKALGDFSRHIGEIKPGTPVAAEGPFGAFTAEASTRDKVALIAAGVGITPIRALAEEMPGNLVLVYRATHPEEIIFRDELEALARRRGIRLCYEVGSRRSAHGKQLLTSDHLTELIPDIAEREVYVCGSPAMTSFIEASVRSAGVARKHIHSEKFAL